MLVFVGYDENKNLNDHFTNESPAHLEKSKFNNCQLCTKYRWVVYQDVRRLSDVNLCNWVKLVFSTYCNQFGSKCSHKNLEKKLKLETHEVTKLVDKSLVDKKIHENSFFQALK